MAVPTATGAAEAGTGSWSEAYKYTDVNSKSTANRWVDPNPAVRTGLPGLTQEKPQSASWFAGNNQIAGWANAVGNVTAVTGLTRSFTYDAENRQTSASINQLTSTYVYDGQGQRVQKTVQLSGGGLSDRAHPLHIRPGTWFTVFPAFERLICA